MPPNLFPSSGPTLADDQMLAAPLPQLPNFSAGELESATPDELLALLIENEDRVPRVLFDQCVARGEAMVSSLDAFYRSFEETVDLDLDDLDDLDEAGDSSAAAVASTGRWWTRLHGIHILGSIAGVAAGELLILALEQIDEEDEEDLQDWLSGHWPHFFANKPPEVIDILHDILFDPRVDFDLRIQSTGVLIAAATADGPQALDAMLNEVAMLVAADHEDDYLRFAIAAQLLDFPRPAHRELLLQLAKSEAMSELLYFSEREVEEAFERATDDPEWLRLPHPLKFYEHEAIVARTQRWASEEAELLKKMQGTLDLNRLEELLATPSFPHVRESPKIGRNEPCPCGSGRKYKQCCL